MAIEIERKFLVKSESYKNVAFDSYEILQGYLAHDNGRSVRVRVTDKESMVTIKGPTDSKGMSRYEWNHSIDREEAQELMKLAQGVVIRKRRYLVHSGPHVFEIDEFFGENEGLVVAEVELASETEVFTKPEFISVEVTGDHRYYNAYLVKHPFKEW